MFDNYPMIFKILFFFSGAFFITYLLIPKIIWVAQQRRLLVKPNGRSSHNIITPAFGGVAFFISFIIMYSFLKNEYLIFSSNYLVSAIAVLFVAGLKDDLVSTTPRAKIAAQLISISLILLSKEFIVSNLNGFLGIYYISPWVIMPLLIVFMLGIINAFNLIDGVDGLATSVGIIIMSFFGFLFYKLDEPFYFLITIIMLGMFFAFLRFNLSSKLNRKLFMGDTGSLFIGFIIVVLTLKLITINEAQFLNYTSIKAENIPILIVSILFIPIFDTTRIMLFRYFTNKPILQPDKNHIHHILINIGYSHIQTSILISILSLFIASIIYQISILFNSYWVLSLLAFLYFFLYGFFYFLNKKLKIKNNI
ncbi:MAG: MraY family glycosyltransferase [Flavobacteriaceae bacterium]|nr:MraY family glycosyltransferase [Flavobacteriaceae bacterium]